MLGKKKKHFGKKNKNGNITAKCKNHNIYGLTKINYYIWEWKNSHVIGI